MVFQCAAVVRPVLVPTAVAHARSHPSSELKARRATWTAPRRSRGRPAGSTGPPRGSGAAGAAGVVRFGNARRRLFRSWRHTVQQKRLDESAILLQKAIGLEPRLLGAHLTLAQVYTLQGKPNLALGMFRRALELDPSNATARLALARSETEKGNYQRSLTWRTRSSRLYAVARRVDRAGDELSEDGESRTRGRSGQGLDAACRCAPGVVDTFALLLVEAAAFAEAIDVLERARQTGPPSYELAFNLGGAYLLNKEPAQALDAYDLALTLKADSIPALRQAAALAEQQGELERALSYWMRAKKIDAG